MTGFSDLEVFLGGFWGFSIKYNRNNPITKHPISMYNNCSTLLYKYNPRHKKTHRIGGRSDNISILLNADSPSLITMNQSPNTSNYILLLT